ncbi:lanthionine synthetase LanC family protein [Streptomyces buecherae]|uniref:lanthionine synthetase LanC family protein n=1 Tax=Streptomyces buecherae TaxID=2763006 RepID=UPI0037955C01
MTAAVRTAAAHLALETSRTLRDPEAIARSLPARSVHTLSYGLAGTALLHACLTHAEPGSARTAAAHWHAATRSLGTAPADGIHTGPGALAASLIIGCGYLPPADPHHALVPRATAWLTARATALARHHYRLAVSQHGTPWAVYDAIKGLTGIGRVLLAARPRNRAEAEPGLYAAVDALTDLTLTARGARPGWWLAADRHPPTTLPIPASGAATTGIAHGIAGPLAFLATAHREGCTRPRQLEAIRTAARWLVEWQSPEHTWPPHVSGQTLDRDDKAAPRAGGRTTAWCYGTPGIAVALTAAHHALGTPDPHHAAHAALNALGARPPTDWDTTGTALCHGTAGVLQCAHRLAHPPLLTHAAHATVYSRPPHPHGFLTGRAGTALALAEFGGVLPRLAHGWDSVLLVS